MASAALTIAQEPQPLIEWPHWGGDTAQTKYSTASEITPANVRELELAWTWQTIDRAMPEHDLRPAGFQNTPRAPKQRSFPCVRRVTAAPVRAALRRLWCR